MDDLFVKLLDISNIYHIEIININKILIVYDSNRSYEITRINYHPKFMVQMNVRNIDSNILIAVGLTENEVVTLIKLVCR